MKTPTKTLLTLAGLALAVIPAMAQTSWTGDATDDISVGANWSAGLPTTPANLGTINSDAQWGIEGTLTDYYLNFTGGTLTHNGTVNPWEISGGEQTFNGGSFTPQSNRTLQLTNGAIFTVNHASSSVTWSNFLRMIDSSVVINAGSLSHTGRLELRDGGALTVNGGASSSGEVRGLANGGSINVNGGSFSAGAFNSSTGTVAVNLGGSTAGTATFASLNATNVNRSFNWFSGSLISLTVTGSPTWAETEWDAGRMTVDGQGVGDLGGWSTVNGSTFDWDGTTNTLALIPEPSTFALLGLAGLAAMAFRRRRK